MPSMWCVRNPWRDILSMTDSAMPRTWASDVPDAMTKKSVASLRPRRSSTTSRWALRSSIASMAACMPSGNAFLTMTYKPRRGARSRHVLHLIENGPGAGPDVRPEDAGSKGHEAVPRLIGRHQRGPHPLRHIGGVRMHHAESDGPRAGSEPALEQREHPGNEIVPAPDPIDRYHPPRRVE